MSPTATVIIAVIALIGAVVVASMIDFDTGGDAPVNVELGEQGPLEQAGEAIDKAASDATK